jgi:hypothetical protein
MASKASSHVHRKTSSSTAWRTDKANSQADEGGAKLKLLAKRNAASGQALIQALDDTSGQGIPGRLLPQIFRKFVLPHLT